MKEWLEKIGLMKSNYKNELIPAAAGVLFIIIGVLGWLLFISIDLGKARINSHLIFVSVIIGSAGLLDDMVGDKNSQGFKGHFYQLFAGKLTTGTLKALISFITIVFIVWSQNVNIVTGIIHLSLILLMTNFINLLDLRPGRAIKFFILFSLLLITMLPFIWIYFLPIFGLIIPYTYYELKGKVMLGDTGANVLGVILGYCFTLWPSLIGKLILLVSLLILTMISEKYSFTEYIAKVKFLDWLDRLGRN